MDSLNYGFEPLIAIPEDMSPWNMGLMLYSPNKFGGYEIIRIEQADIELHHEVVVLDENGEGLSGIGVMFGFPGGGGKFAPWPKGGYYWWGGPTVVRGNYQTTDHSGYAKHTFDSGGEDIWVWDIDREDNCLKLPSPIVKNCTWVRTPVGKFEHTGVKLTFQRRKSDVIPEINKMGLIENRVLALEEKVRLLELHLRS